MAYLLSTRIRVQSRTVLAFGSAFEEAPREDELHSCIEEESTFITYSIHSLPPSFARVPSPQSAQWTVANMTAHKHPLPRERARGQDVERRAIEWCRLKPRPLTMTNDPSDTRGRSFGRSRSLLSVLGSFVFCGRCSKAGSDFIVLY